jgi:hypothetical protein
MARSPSTETATALEQMHAVYRQEGADRAAALHVIYHDAPCPHEGCQQNLRAIDFRLQAFGGRFTIRWCAPRGTIPALPGAVRSAMVVFISRFARSGPSMTKRPTPCRNSPPIGAAKRSFFDTIELWRLSTAE